MGKEGGKKEGRGKGGRGRRDKEKYAYIAHTHTHTHMIYAYIWVETQRVEVGRAGQDWRTGKPAMAGATCPGGPEERLISHGVWGGETPQAPRPCGCGNSFLPGPVGLRDSRNAGPRVWRQANAIRPITDLEVQIWKFEEAQLALPNCKEM